MYFKNDFNTLISLIIVMQTRQEEQDVIETYILDDPTISKFHSLSLAEKKRVIRLGMLFIENGNTSTQLWENDEWDKKLQNTIKSYEEKLASIQLKLDKSNLDFKDYCSSRDKHQQTLIDSAIVAEQQKYASQIKALQDTNNSLRKDLSDIHVTLEEKFNSRLMKTIEQYNDKMETMRQDYENKLSRTVNSTLKGKDGEVYVYGKLNMMFPKADIEDTHNFPHRGDFIMRENGFTMMIETKNYSKNVQKSEIDKFYRDIDEPGNSDIQCAVFVSLHTGICNKDDFQFEIRNMIPILFIHKLNENFDNLFLAVKFFKLIIDQTGLDLSSKEVLDAFKNISTTIKRNFRKQKTILDKYHSEQMQLITSQSTNIVDLYNIIKVKY